MRKLYDVLEDFDTLNLEIAYYMKAQKGFIESELKDVYLKKRELFMLIDGIESTQERLLSRLDKVSKELAEIMRAEKKQISE